MLAAGTCLIRRCMALAHRYEPTYGVQFHPVSILAQEGQTLLMSFLLLAAAVLRAARLWLGGPDWPQRRSSVASPRVPSADTTSSSCTYKSRVCIGRMS
ncbi:glutamine amidotransferase-related protein [Bradyrhizobium sp. ORS 111]|uniref:glutamine amidotransferase-related protein n=1 Tax=Bradyrhizobium sp. ORS 111 TaxID=1685958 RepID=UPI003890D363